MPIPAERAYVPDMPQLITAEELLYTNVPNKRTELVRGRLIVREPPGFRHADITARLTTTLSIHVRTGDLGLVLSGDAGFRLATNPDTVRGADIAFVRRERLPDPLPVGFAPFAPDLVVEILSPGDRPGETLAKVADWLSAGTRLVWVIDAERRLVRVYRADGTETTLDAEAVLDDEDVLPGFSCTVASIIG